MMSGLKLMCQLFLHHVSLTVPSSDGRFLLLSTTSISINSHRSLSFHLYFLWVRAITNICHGPSPPQSLQFWSLLSPHFVQKFDRDGSVPYTDLTRNDTLTWSFLHSPSLINFCPCKTHFTLAPCSPSSVALVFRWSSSLKHTSAPLCCFCL